MSKNPLHQVGVGPQGEIVMGGLFKMQDTHGFPLACSISESRRRGWIPGLFWFFVEATCAGWPRERTIRVIFNAMVDAGEGQAAATLIKGKLEGLKMSTNLIRDLFATGGKLPVPG